MRKTTSLDYNVVWNFSLDVYIPNYYVPIVSFEYILILTVTGCSHGHDDDMKLVLKKKNLHSQKKY